MKIIKHLSTALLILLYVYTAACKLGDPDEFRGQLYNQAFSPGLADFLFYALPGAELATVVLLCLPRTERAGLWLSLGLLLVFTTYIALAQLHFWPRVPCSCGGVISHLGWTGHLVFNLFFIALNLLAIRGKPKTFEQSRQPFFT